MNLKLKWLVTSPFSASFIWSSEQHHLGTPWLWYSSKGLVLLKTSSCYPGIVSWIVVFFFSTMKLNSSATMSYLSPLQLRSVVMKMWLQRYVPNSSKSSVSQQWFSQSWDLKHGVFNKVEWLWWFYKCVLQWDSKEPTLYNAEQQPRSMGVFNLC